MSPDFNKVFYMLTRSFLLIVLTCFLPSAQAANLYAHPITLSALNSTETIPLNTFKGELVYLDFWASWCIPCKESFPFMNQLQNRYKNEGLRIITINLDKTPQAALTFLEAHPAHFPIYHDPEQQLTKQLSVKGLPTSFLFTPDGELHQRMTGFNQYKAQKLSKTIENLLQPSPSKKVETKL